LKIFKAFLNRVRFLSIEITNLNAHMIHNLLGIVDKYELENMNNSEVQSTDGDSSFICDKCDQKFNTQQEFTQQELKEHGRNAHQLL
jgi:uncharacterized C2H2 Zn-finger protein